MCRNSGTPWIHTGGIPSFQQPEIPQRVFPLLAWSGEEHSFDCVCRKLWWKLLWQKAHLCTSQYPVAAQTFGVGWLRCFIDRPGRCDGSPGTAAPLQGSTARLPRITTAMIKMNAYALLKVFVLSTDALIAFSSSLAVLFFPCENTCYYPSEWLTAFK